MIRHYEMDATVTMDHEPTDDEVELADQTLSAEWSCTGADGEDNTIRLYVEDATSAPTAACHVRIVRRMREALGACEVETCWHELADPVEFVTEPENAPHPADDAVLDRQRYELDVTVTLDRPPTDDETARIARLLLDEWSCHSVLPTRDGLLVRDEIETTSPLAAHAGITASIRRVFPRCRIETRWQPQAEPEVHTTEKDEEPDRDIEPSVRSADEQTRPTDAQEGQR
ncbi:MAG: hypothetical protein IT379_30260 [Deltaproteobacteria bacterium]|nr:hypothetical protein [Deltaproteobacteria bacterium]